MSFVAGIRDGFAYATGIALFISAVATIEALRNWREEVTTISTRVDKLEEEFYDHEDGENDDDK